MSFVGDIGHITLATIIRPYWHTAHYARLAMQNEASGLLSLLCMFNMPNVVCHFYAVHFVYLQGSCTWHSPVHNTFIQHIPVHCDASWFTKHIHVNCAVLHKPTQVARLCVPFSYGFSCNKFIRKWTFVWYWLHHSAVKTAPSRQRPLCPVITDSWCTQLHEHPCVK